MRNYTAVSAAAAAARARSSARENADAKFIREIPIYLAVKSTFRRRASLWRRARPSARRAAR